MSESSQPTLLIIDGHSLAFRAFHAAPEGSFITAAGQHTGAIHGFISMLLKIVRDERPTHLGVAFDVSRQSFRTREYPEYKGTRAETPAAFIGQVPLLVEALEAMNIRSLSQEDYEADDILATWAEWGSAAGFSVLVVSGDRDAIQLVNERITLLYPSSRGISALTRYTPEKVFERYGVRPEQYPEVAALVGEKSDNLIGVDRVGEKTATKLIQEYGTVAAVLAHADEIPGLVGKNLREQGERALRNRRLNQLVRDMELPVGVEDMKRIRINRDAVGAIFDVLEFRTLKDRVFRDDDETFGKDASGKAEPVILGTPPEVRSLTGVELDNWLALATEPLGVCIGRTSNGITDLGISGRNESVWVSLEERDTLGKWLSSDAPKIFQDAKNDTLALQKAGISVAGVVGCVTLATWMVTPGEKKKNLTLDLLLQKYLGTYLPKPDPNQLLPEAEGLNLASEAWYLLKLYAELMARLDQESLRVIEQIEIPLIPVLVRMEERGIAVNRNVFVDMSARLGVEVSDIAAKAYAAIGREVNLSSPKQLQEVLFTELGMPKTRAIKTGHSTDEASLIEIQERKPHPFLDHLLEHREVNKMRQIVETLLAEVGQDDRIHTSYEQIGTATGRMSSIAPNLQNIPIKTAVGEEIRSAFRVGDDFDSLLTADYSQIEMRIMAHLSGDESLIEAFRAGEDLHRFVGSRIFGVAPDEVTVQMRGKVKAMSYGLVYGLSSFGLSKQLHIPVSEAKALMSDYFARFGAVRAYLRKVVEQARIDGYTSTIFGRRRPFEDLASPNRILRENAERQALNAPIQGSAADIIKRAMLTIDTRIRAEKLASRMLLQVHDELVFEIAPGEEEILTRIVSGGMCDAAELLVPLEVQLGRGVTWASAAH